jgi:hypothetical protein
MKGLIDKMNARMKTVMAGVVGAAVLAAGAAAASAQEGEGDAGKSGVPEWLVPEVEVGVDFASRQLTRGLVDNADPILTGGASVGVGPVSFGVEGIFDTTDWGETDGGYGDREWKYQELDLTPALSWTFEKGLPTPLEAELAYCWQHHPSATDEEGNDANPDTQTINFAVGLPDVLLSPSFSLEWDIDEDEGALYGVLGIGHAFELLAAADEEADPVLALELNAGLGIGNAKRNECDAEWDHASLKDVQVGAALPWNIGPVCISPYAYCTEQVEHALREAAEESDPDGHSFQWVAGVSVAASF